MGKFFGGVLVGAFVGAVVLEIVRTARPELVKRVEKHAKKATDSLFENLRDELGFGDFRRLT